MSLARNPIFEREFVAFCRTRRWFVFRTMMVTALTLTLWIFLSHGTRRFDDGQLDQLGRLLFGACVYVQIGFVFFTTPAIISDLIVSERRKRCLEILLTTPLGPLRIVLGKVLSRVSLILVILVGSFPVVSISLLYGGVRGGQVAGLFAVSLGTLLGLAGTSILISAFAKRTGTAAVLSYVVPIFYCIGIIFLAYAVLDYGDGSKALSYAHPVYAASTVAFESLYTMVRLRGLSPQLGYLLLGAAVFAIGVLLAAWRLARERGSAGLAILRRREDELSPGPEPPTPHRPRRRGRGLFRHLKNPVLWKEMHLVNASHSRTLFHVALSILLLSELCFVLLADADSIDRPEAHVSLISIQILLLFVVTAVNGATSVIAEREARTLELLNVTLLTPAQITTGKVVGTLRSVSFLALVPIVHLLVAALTTEVSMSAFAAFVMVLILLLVFLAVHGVRASILARRGPRAVLRTMGLLGFLLIGLPLLAGILAFLTAGDDVLFSFLLMGQPLALTGYPVVLFSGESGDEPQLILYAIVWLGIYAGLALGRYVALPFNYRRSLKREDT